MISDNNNIESSVFRPEIEITTDGNYKLGQKVNL